MYFFLIHAKPHPDSPLHDDIPGAMVKVWVNADNYAVAEATAVQRIQRRQWYVVAFEDAVDYGESMPQHLDSAQARLFDDARVNGIAALYMPYTDEAYKGVGRY